jgi:hypothetical protein
LLFQKDPGDCREKGSFIATLQNILKCLLNVNNLGLKKDRSNLHLSASDQEIVCMQLEGILKVVLVWFFDSTGV